MVGQALLFVFAGTLVTGGAANDKFGALAPFVGDSVAIQSPQGNWYWTRVTGPKDKFGPFDRIEPSASSITPDSIFDVKQVGISNKVTLWQKTNGKFLSVVNRGCPQDDCANFIEPAKQVADEYCEFEVIPNGDDLSQVALRAKDGQFLQFVNRGKTNYIEASGTGVSKWNQFWPRPGSLTPWSVKDVFFDIAKAKISDSMGIVGGTETLVNNGDEKQTMTFSFKRSLSVSTSSSYTGGFSLGVTTTFVTKIPFLEKGQVETSAETTHEWTQGKSNTGTQDVTLSVPLVVGARKKGTTTFVMTQAKADLPYIITYINYGLGGATKTSTGTYHLEQYYNIVATYSETPVAAHEAAVIV